jgi:hypothetical protein
VLTFEIRSLKPQLIDIRSTNFLENAVIRTTFQRFEAVAEIVYTMELPRSDDSDLIT